MFDDGFANNGFASNGFASNAWGGDSEKSGSGFGDSEKTKIETKTVKTSSILQKMNDMKSGGKNGVSGVPVSTSVSTSSSSVRNGNDDNQRLLEQLQELRDENNRLKKSQNDTNNLNNNINNNINNNSNNNSPNNANSTEIDNLKKKSKTTNK